MGYQFRVLLSTIGTTWRALAAIFAAFAVGMTVALVFAGWVNLPKEVRQQGDAIVDLRHEQARQAARVDSLVADLTRVRCIVVAEALHDDPIRACGL